MLDSLIREISARWGLADQGRPLVQMLVAYINQPANGGLTGFLDKFRQAGWGGMVNSWVGNHNSSPEVPTTAQIETVLGGNTGFLQQASQRLGLSREKIAAAVAGFLPMLVARMTPDGSIPMSLPAEFDSLAREGQSMLGLGTGAAAAGAATAAGAYGTTRDSSRAHAHTSAPAAAAVSEPSSSGGFGKWLPWIIGILAVLFGVSYCSKDRTSPADAPATQSVPAPADPAPASSAPSTTDTAPALAPAPAVGTTSDGSAMGSNNDSAYNSTSTGSDTSSTGGAVIGPGNGDSSSHSTNNTTSSTNGSMSGDSTAAAANFTVPDGADVVDDMHNGMPVLRVFFDIGKTDVAASFSDKSKSLVEFLKANPDVTAVVSGFNDPTGDAARNAELAKERAQAVKSALEAAGVPADRAVLEKPAETTDTGATNAESRRVDVMLRR